LDTHIVAECVVITFGNHDPNPDAIVIIPEDSIIRNYVVMTPVGKTKAIAIVVITCIIGYYIIGHQFKPDPLVKVGIYCILCDYIILTAIINIHSIPKIIRTIVIGNGIMTAPVR